LDATTVGGLTLAGKKIVLGISGGVAAYKAAHLARELRKRGAELRVVMTEHATHFVAPLTFATLTQAPVCTSLWGQTDSWSMEHISNARWGDMLVVAPATANIVAKFAHGIADDALTTFYLAWRGPVLVAPAMNTAMYEHPACRANEAILRERGVEIVGPDTGELACGEEGAGRLADVPAIVAAIGARLSSGRPFEGIRVLVTAGPTREFLDPVRFFSNPSTGKMGFALAKQAACMGAQVTLVAGPAVLPTPLGVERVNVVSADQMCEAVMSRCDKADMLVFAAAVADFAPAQAAAKKITKRRWTGALRLRETPDIARAFGERKRADQVSVGFAADTNAAIRSARRKLREKRFDFIFANPLRTGGTGILPVKDHGQDAHATADDGVFGSDDNRGWLVGPTGRARRFDRIAKTELARRILLHALEIFRQKRGGSARCPKSTPTT